MGADVVVASSYAGSAEWRRLLGDLPAAKLAINAGGDTTAAMARALAPGGTLVSLGGSEVKACCGTYADEGRKRALELRESGKPVVVALREGAGTWDAAVADGWVPGETLFDVDECLAGCRGPMVSPEALLEGSVELKAFQMTQWLEANSPCELLDEVVGLNLGGTVVDLKPFSHFNHAMAAAKNEANSVVMVMNE